MKSGMPSLLNAIFGKKDLSSVSLNEMYELINEFPSFNAGHYLLSKKLQEENDVSYEKENQLTALYFNNPFWLQTLLNDAVPADTQSGGRPAIPVPSFVEEHQAVER